MNPATPEQRAALSSLRKQAKFVNDEIDRLFTRAMAIGHDHGEEACTRDCPVGLFISTIVDSKTYLVKMVTVLEEICR